MSYQSLELRVFRSCVTWSSLRPWTPGAQGMSSTQYCIFDFPLSLLFGLRYLFSESVQAWMNERLSKRVNSEIHTFGDNTKILQRLYSSPHPFSDLRLQLLSVNFDSISLTFVYVPLWVLNHSLLFQSSCVFYGNSSKGLLVPLQRVVSGAAVDLSFGEDFDS